MEGSPYSALRYEIAAMVSNALSALDYSAAGIESTIDFSKINGDMSCSVSFRIAKEKRDNPNSIAQNILSKIEKSESIEKITVEGGYLNFYINKERFAKSTIAYSLSLAKDVPVSDIGRRNKVIIEYPSANPIHPLHIGQLRNMLLGDVISKVHALCGYSVESEDFIEDLGLQAVQALWGYLNTQAPLSKKFDHWYGEIYANVNKMMDGQDLKEDFSKLAKLMEKSGTRESQLSREVAEKCVRAQYETAFKYNIYHDLLVWESDILGEKLLEKALRILLDSGFARQEKDGKFKGCIVIDLSTIENLPNEFKGLKEQIKVLIRNDGTASYVAKDIAFHMWKFGMLEDTFKYSVFMEKQPNGKPLYTTSSSGKSMPFGHVEEAINIIDVKQSYPQALLRLAFGSIGRKDIAEGIKHLAYGRVELERGTLSGRKGVEFSDSADGLLESAKENALALIKDRFKLEANEQQSIAQMVALSAVKFEFLKVSPEKWITFSWKGALAFEGNSGPYCQYMHARAIRLIETSGMSLEMAKSAQTNLLSGDHEFELLKKMALLRETVEKTCAELRPNVMTEYANDLAYAFSNFYEQVPILKTQDEKEKAARIALTYAFANTMKYALGVLGIDAPEKM